MSAKSPAFQNGQAVTRAQPEMSRLLWVSTHLYAAHIAAGLPRETEAIRATVSEALELIDICEGGGPGG